MGNLLLLFDEASATIFPRGEIFLHGAFSLERTLIISPVGHGPDGDDAGHLIGNVVELACAVQLHGPWRRDILGYFLDFRGWDLPWLKTVLEFGASLKWSILGHTGMCGPADVCTFTKKTLKGTSVSCEVLKGLVGGPVSFFGPSRLGLELIRHIIEAMACVAMKRGCGRFDRRDGFKVLPRLHLLGHVVILKCSGISKFHSRGTVSLFWFTKFTSLNAPSSVIILKKKRERAFLNTEGNCDLVNIMSRFSHCQTPVRFL